MTYNKIYVSFGALRKITGPALQWQYNETQYLIIKGLNLPEVYAVDFMNQGDTETITMVPTSEGVLIPDQYLLDGRPLIAYIVVVDGESVNTIAQITFPVNTRGKRTDMSPEPAEQQQIDQLIATMNEAVEDSQASAEESERQAGIAEQAAAHIEEAVERAETAASNAETSAENASSSATNAANSASTATTKADQAASSAQSASQNASAANASAGSASQSAASARESASQAGASASSAAGYANSASDSAGQAAESASSASGSASQAANNASSANQSATSASQSATTATTKATEASASADRAEAAKTAAVSAKEAAETAANSVIDLAENLQETLENIDAYGMDIVSVSGTTVTLEAEAETMYVCGELASLDITSLPSAGVVFIIYESGSTATVVTYPETLKMPVWWESEPNQTVMIGITNGTLGSVQTWE